MANVLVVDDEQSIRELLTLALEHAGYDVQVAATALEARNRLLHQAPDMLILDVMLPDDDGIELCRSLRKQGTAAPVLFLTARHATAEKVRGLAVRGDDYLTKPFSVQELLARVRALLRRSGTAPLTAREVVTCADVEIDDERHEVRRAGEPVALSPTEYKLLRFLVASSGRAVSKTEILDHVWSDGSDVGPSVVDTYVSYLRKKLDPLGPPLIVTVRGVGYRMQSP